ncbi:GH92 family glycosyl hydrolase [Coprobacter tertius]|uniref:GH92 family glycosyl hydrolase n=1 Tax=Coprobacter tertius TaxID=2944915 RepID=A0ABT1MF15_9BACT|nr:GH92 family glycosyl hydrolase [Coprobacter tertius]MCP9610951.1 GH92 family glycosyl hydrolase [Coprobacter tertius]
MNHYRKIVTKCIIALCLLFFNYFYSFAQNQNKITDYTSYVDAYIGSGGHGHVFVGASVPFGAIQAGPQNIHKGWDWCSGYHYSDSVIIGFSHTHLSGTGCTDLGDILVMPFTGRVRTTRGDQNNIKGSCSSYYKHENESVAPGYYSLLMNNGIKAELTTTERVALHHYTYPARGDRRILINLKEGNGDRAYDTYLKKIDDYTIEGYRFSKGWSPRHKVYFTLKTDQPIQTVLVYNDDELEGRNELSGPAVKGVILFKENPKDVMMKISISSVSCENATKNMNAELPHWNFDKTRQEAIDKWNRELGCIDIETTDEKAKKIFYTSLYHTLIAPTLYCDVNGDFRGHDDKIYSAKDWKNYSTFSLWDTYRTLHPLFTIIKPHYVADFVNSMLSMYDQQEKLPIWPLIGGETNQMPGYSSVPVIADAMLKGFTGFDYDRAYKNMVATSVYPKQHCIPYVLEKGYIPCDKVSEATSIAMEYAVDDWGIAQVAKKAGKTADYKEYLKRGKYYEQYFDKEIGFIRPKMSDGSWRTPYNPLRSVHGVGDFCEGNGWHYTFFVPQNPEGLISLFGGDKPFITKLDSLFTVTGDMGDEASPDISGLIGMYAHGNEPSHHVAYLYPYAGEQWKTAEKVRYIQDEFYTDKPDGVIGNEDCGQMSAWHIMSALGFYQVSPSGGQLVFGSPLFTKAIIELPGNKKFEVIAQNNNKKNIYIQSVTLNGKPYLKSFIDYNDIMKGGKLVFKMGNKPNKQFGKAPINRPKTIE